MVEGLGWETFEEFQQNFTALIFGMMDPNALLSMGWKWQRGDVARNTNGDLAAALGSITAKTFVMPIEQDMFFPPRDCIPEQEMIPGAELRMLHSIAVTSGCSASSPPTPPRWTPRSQTCWPSRFRSSVSSVAIRLCRIMDLRRRLWAHAIRPHDTCRRTTCQLGPFQGAPAGGGMQPPHAWLPRRPASEMRDDGRALRKSTRPVPKRSVRMRSGGITATRRVERWRERLPWSPMVTLSVRSSRSPMRVDSSCRSFEADAPPRMILTIEASQMVLAAWSPHLLRAWASDWRTAWW